MTKLKIRSATRHDAKQILRFIQALAEYEKLADQVSATEPMLIQTLFPESGSPAAEVQLAFQNDVPVGFALYFSSYSTFLAKKGIYLEDLFVDPSARGQGVGEALLKRVASIAVARGAERLEWSVLDWNKPAIDFYRRRGANPMNEWTTFRVDGAALVALGLP
ncbi:MAG: GNAT family N-acetyltransferase [Deltaproteobacteria bacterium]|jgi:GNAT superfamily N-acetyltransferase|nr:GNAT family N-acetyltransferase [Deltaproteobacteria bacterium]